MREIVFGNETEVTTVQTANGKVGVFVYVIDNDAHGRLTDDPNGPSKVLLMTKSEALALAFALGDAAGGVA